MSQFGETLDDGSQSPRPRSPRRPTPGLLLVFSAGEAFVQPLPIGDGPLIIGRGTLAPLGLDAPRMSRQHASVSSEGSRWRITDLDSRNGTFLDGERVTGSVESASARMLRTGDTLFLLCPDLERYQGATVELREGIVVGPGLAPAWQAIERAARQGTVVHLTGETGTGKELAARHFHDAGAAPRGPFVPVNCATVTPPLAERLLFGARRGAYSGADADSEGLVQAAHGGTLFLDEIGELELSVQAKLLRVLESSEVMPLGASRARKVDLRLCSATHDNLAARVGSGQFREDLYFRVAQPVVALPPLRERPADLAFIVTHLLAGGPPPHASLIEAVLSRPWPGNVRELITQLRQAAQVTAEKRGAAVTAEHLALEAGAFNPHPGNAEDPERAWIRRALDQHDGNVSAAARSLGLHRTQLRRLMSRHELKRS